MSPLTQTGIKLALEALRRHGRAATVTWPGDGASLVTEAQDVSEKVTLLPGKRETQIAGGVPVVLLNAVMSPVKRNPVGATVTLGNASYRIVSSDDLGEAPDAIAAHRLVLV